MHCPNCGTRVEPSNSFCAWCGDPLDQDRLAAVAAEDSPSTEADDTETESAEATIDGSATQAGGTSGGAQGGAAPGTLLAYRARIVTALSTTGDGKAAFAALSSRIGAAEFPGHQTVISTMDGDDTESPVWTFALLGGAWFVFVVGLEELLAGRLGTTGSLAIGGFVLGVPLLWLDARGTIEAGGLPVDRPLYVVVPVCALYVVALPAYLGYRLYVGV